MAVSSFDSDLIAAGDDFLSRYKQASVGHPTHNVLFVDLAVLDFTYLKKAAAKASKIVSVLLVLAQDGTLLKPLVVRSKSIKGGQDGLQDEGFSTTTETGTMDEGSFVEWMNQGYLGQGSGGTQILLLGHVCSWLSSPGVVAGLKQHSVELMLLPQGLGCRFSPFRNIMPVFRSTIHAIAQHSTCTLPRHRITQPDVFAWVHHTLRTLKQEHGQLLREGFDSLK
jgi:hypothetical protein